VDAVPQVASVHEEQAGDFLITFQLLKLMQFSGRQFKTLSVNVESAFVNMGVGGL
jgi:hypothetical protein